MTSSCFFNNFCGSGQISFDMKNSICVPKLVPYITSAREASRLSSSLVFILGKSVERVSVQDFGGDMRVFKVWWKSFSKMLNYN